tara:strand:+ start:313 stop:567 length:255 start_codon:yes stop_codon:yes gene_type:complete
LPVWSDYSCCVLAEAKKSAKKSAKYLFLCHSKKSAKNRQKNRQKISKKSTKKSAKNRFRKHTSSPDVQKNRFSRAEFFAAHANS